MSTTKNNHPDELITSLIEEQNSSAYLKEIYKEIGEKDEEATNRLLTAKYKIYVILLIVLGLILGFRLIPLTQGIHKSRVAEVEKSNHQLDQLNEQTKEYELTKKFLFNVEKYHPAIISCVNDQLGCEDIPVEINEKFSTAVSYLQLGNLESDKMKVNEKKILKNLDQYLIKQDPKEQNSLRNGTIVSIAIGEQKTSSIDAKLIELPVTIKIEFNNKDNLISFVKNIEESIVPNVEDRILYTIQEIKYDMMTYDKKQETTIDLLAYYFN